MVQWYHLILYSNRNSEVWSTSLETNIGELDTVFLPVFCRETNAQPSPNPNEIVFTHPEPFSIGELVRSY